MLSYDNALAVFQHPKNITVGRGRVLWADATTCTNGLTYPAGWVLPGGLRTLDEVVAHTAAIALDRMIGECGA